MTSAGNLAIVLAHAHQPVVLIDTDLRRPCIGLRFNLDDGAHLTDVLAGHADVEDVTHPTDSDGLLNVITSGRIPPNPSEVLGSQRMLNLVDELSRDNMVLLDAPPLAPVTDAAVLSAHTDGALVISSGKTTIDALDHAMESLRKPTTEAIDVSLSQATTRHTATRPARALPED